VIQDTASTTLFSISNLGAISASSSATSTFARGIDLVDLGVRGVRIDYSIGPGASAAVLELFSVGGRRVRTLATGTHATGRSSLNWDRTTESGVRVARGVYVLRLRAGGREAYRKFVLVSP
jgi:hypothetical protein